MAPPLRGTSTADSFGQKLSSLWIFWADPWHLSISPEDVVIPLSGVCVMSDERACADVDAVPRCLTMCARDPALRAPFAPICMIHEHISSDFFEV